MEITDAERRAVRRQDCEHLGHVLAIDEAISHDSDTHGGTAVRVRSADGHRVPHLFCRRCGEVWLIPFGSAPTYADAIALLHALVPYADDLIPPPPPEPEPLVRPAVGVGEPTGTPPEAGSEPHAHDLDPRELVEPA